MTNEELLIKLLRKERIDLLDQVARLTEELAELLSKEDGDAE